MSTLPLVTRMLPLPHLKRNDAFSKDTSVGGWQSRIIVDTSLPDIPFWADGLRKIYQQSDKDYNAIIQSRWKQQAGKPTRVFFQEVLEEEAQAFGTAIVQLSKEFYEKQWAIRRGEVDYSRQDLIPTPAFTITDRLGKYFIQRGLSDKEIALNVLEYLTSPILKELPFIKISSALQAAAARKYCAGQQKSPKHRKASILSDISTISTLMPFCDAMLIDNECRNYIDEPSVREHIPYSTSLFSTSNRENFLTYLDQIEKHASEGHLAIVREVYGSSWEKPFYNMFEV